MKIDILSRVLFRDALLLIVNKPAGVPVHAGPKGGPNMEDYFDALRFGLPQAPNLAHRLDRDTSGCLVLGRHRKALSKLGRLFASGLIEKTYWAIVVGHPPAESGRIALPLRKLTPRSGWKMVVDPVAGQNAVTDYRVLGRSDGLTWMELMPRTGRTHQIRVHCEALGCPLLGDTVYGRAAGAEIPTVPLHLHARAISLPLYPKREAVRVSAPVPPHMLQALKACGLAGEDQGPIENIKDVPHGKDQPG